MPILKEWKLISSFPYENNLKFLQGKVYNDTRFADGTEIRTSILLEVDDGVAQTQNTMYILE